MIMNLYRKWKMIFCGNPLAAKMVRATIDENGMAARFVSPVVAGLANEAARMLEVAEAPNYVAFDMWSDKINDVIRVTVQRASGESPAEQNARLRKELSAIKAEAAD